jgi:hypothetical protein
MSSKLSQAFDIEQAKMDAQYDSLKISLAAIEGADNQLKKEHDAAVGNRKDSEEHVRLETEHAELIVFYREVLEKHRALMTSQTELGNKYVRGEITEEQLQHVLGSIEANEKKMMAERRAIEKAHLRIIADHERMIQEHTRILALEKGTH